MKTALDDRVRCPRLWCRANICWYAEGYYSRTIEETPEALRFRRPDIPIIKPKKTFRNPLIYAMELNQEMVRDDLTRKQLAERHGITSDRVTQWLCLLKLPDEEKARILALGDYWERQIVTERELRLNRRNRVRINASR